MPELRDNVPAVRRAMRKRPLPSSGHRSARRDVALVTGWLRSLAPADGRVSAAEPGEPEQATSVPQP